MAAKLKHFYDCGPLNESITHHVSDCIHFAVNKVKRLKVIDMKHSIMDGRGNTLRIRQSWTVINQQLLVDEVDQLG
eukprot:10161287-Ditylum_brightwellii.AAC.1